MSVLLSHVLMHRKPLLGEVFQVCLPQDPVSGIMSASLLSFFTFPFTRQSENFVFEVLGSRVVSCGGNPTEVHVKAGIRDGRSEGSSKAAGAIHILLFKGALMPGDGMLDSSVLPV